jgi:hypothetical protein
MQQWLINLFASLAMLPRTLQVLLILQHLPQPGMSIIYFIKQS